MAIIKCKMCGGDLDLIAGQSVAECEFCGTRQTVPAADNEKKLTLFARANRLRAACEFDKAAGIYESIVADFPEEAEAYWGLVLCKYGIEYVDDPASGKKIPTCHRSSFDTVMEDANLEQALENADVPAQKIYRQEAKAIEEIRKGILEVSSQEAPYDIFICYKETDENGDRTLDSVIAQDIYDALTDKGYRVFFSRITLEDKLGEAYEPYIFAALNSAKVMLAVGTCFEYYNAVWVKNEWSRYIKICAADKSKHLIPCYKNLDAYDMPKEFQHLQGQDMGKMGAIQDLLRGIEKYIPLKQQAQPSVVIQPSVSANSAVVEPLMRRAQLFLEEKDFRNASTYFDKVLDVDPENALAYAYKVCAAFKLVKLEDLAAAAPSAFADKHFKSAVRFADPNFKNILQSYEVSAKQLHNSNQACQDQRNAKSIKDYQEAAVLFDVLGTYKDAAERASQCRKRAEEMLKNDYGDACHKQKVMATADQANGAAAKFDALGNYADSKARAAQCREAAAKFAQEEAQAKKEAQEKAAAEKAAKEAALQAAKKKKARTTGTVLGLIAALIVAAVVIVTTVIIPKKEYEEAVARAERYLSEGDYYDAKDVLLELNDPEAAKALLLATAEQLLAEDEMYDADTVLTILSEDFGDTDAMDLYYEAIYNDGLADMNSGLYKFAATSFGKIHTYKDARQLYQQCSYLAGKDELSDYNVEDALTRFQDVGDYEDAGDYLTYCNAILQAEDDLFSAEELLLQLPQDFEDSANLLELIENYRHWNKTYTCTSYQLGQDYRMPRYSYAKVLVRYLYSHSDDGYHVDVVCCTWPEGGNATTYPDYTNTLDPEMALSSSFSYISGYPEEHDFWDEIEASTSKITLTVVNDKYTDGSLDKDIYIFSAE